VGEVSLGLSESSTRLRNSHVLSRGNTRFLRGPPHSAVAYSCPGCRKSHWRVTSTAEAHEFCDPAIRQGAWHGTARERSRKGCQAAGPGVRARGDRVHLAERKDLPHPRDQGSGPL